MPAPTPPPLSPLQTEALRLLTGAKPHPRFALGRNAYSASVGRVIDLDGFIDDFTGEREFEGRPVVRTTEIPGGAAVVSCVVEARPVTALRRLSEVGLTRVIDYFTLVRHLPGTLHPVVHLDGSLEDVDRHPEAYAWLRQRLADAVSVDVLDRVLALRCAGDLARMTGFTVDVDGQYFEPFVPIHPGTVFVDGGGFDGATTAGFCRRCASHGGVHLFEPNPAALAEATRRLGTSPGIQLYPAGLHDRTGHLHFDGGGGSASRITDSGPDIIQVTTLDEAVAGPVNLLKLDVEGAELAALRGASAHIEKHHPALAVCVYHRQPDFREVPELVLGLRSDYEVYLRHYTEGVLETVMYFVPRKGGAR